MKRRSIAGVLLLTLFTFGLYALIWCILTKNEMNRAGAKIPTALLLFIPFANVYWFWRYGDGVRAVTGGKMSTGVAFLLLVFLGPIGMMIVQAELNEVAGKATGAVANAA